jgi:hypothetical protein
MKIKDSFEITFDPLTMDKVIENMNSIDDPNFFLKDTVIDSLALVAQTKLMQNPESTLAQTLLSRSDANISSVQNIYGKVASLKEDKKDLVYRDYKINSDKDANRALYYIKIDDNKEEKIEMPDVTRLDQVTDHIMDQYKVRVSTEQLNILLSHADQASIIGLSDNLFLASQSCDPNHPMVFGPEVGDESGKVRKVFVFKERKLQALEAHSYAQVLDSNSSDKKEALSMVTRMDLSNYSSDESYDKKDDRKADEYFPKYAPKSVSIEFKPQNDFEFYMPEKMYEYYKNPQIKKDSFLQSMLKKATNLINKVKNMFHKLFTKNDVYDPVDFALNEKPAVEKKSNEAQRERSNTISPASTPHASNDNPRKRINTIG